MWKQTDACWPAKSEHDCFIGQIQSSVILLSWDNGEVRRFLTHQISSFMLMRKWPWEKSTGEFVLQMEPLFYRYWHCCPERDSSKEEFITFIHSSSVVVLLYPAARWILDLFRILQQPLGCLYGAKQIDEGWQVPALLRGLSPPPANDWHCHRWILAHPCPENLQVSTPVGGASQIHCTGAQVWTALVKVTFNCWLRCFLMLARLSWQKKPLLMHSCAPDYLCCSAVGIFIRMQQFLSSYEMEDLLQLSGNVFGENILSTNLACYCTIISNHVKSFSFKCMTIGSLRRSLTMNRIAGYIHN